MYNYNKEIRNIVYDYATKQQQQLLDAQQKADDREFTLMRDNLSDAQSWASEAIKQNQGNVARQIMALNVKSPNFQTQLANLVGQIQKKTEIAEISQIEQRLLASKAGGQYVDGNVYLLERARADMSPNTFDERFGYLLSPGDKERYRLTTGAGGTSPSDDVYNNL